MTSHAVTRFQRKISFYRISMSKVGHSIQKAVVDLQITLNIIQKRLLKLNFQLIQLMYRICYNLIKNYLESSYF